MKTSKTALDCQQPDVRSQVYTAVTQVSSHSDPPHDHARHHQHAKSFRDDKTGNTEQCFNDSPTPSQNVLGLDYSSSSDEED